MKTSIECTDEAFMIAEPFRRRMLDVIDAALAWYDETMTEGEAIENLRNAVKAYKDAGGV